MLILPISNAWDWNTHKLFVDRVYYSLNLTELNLTLMEEGSITPDKDFKDTYLHHCPYSFGISTKWLRIAKEAYLKKDYENSSYAFGVASHYITDSFSNPHYLPTEPYLLHQRYEKQVDYYTSKTGCGFYTNDTNSTLFEESINSRRLWNSWLIKKDKKIPENQVGKAMELVYSTSLTTFNKKCVKVVKFENSFVYFSWKMLLVFIVLILIGIMLVKKF